METTRVDGVRRVIEASTLSQAAPGQRRVARAPPGLVDAVDDARRRGPVRFVVAPEPGFGRSGPGLFKSAYTSAKAFSLDLNALSQEATFFATDLQASVCAVI